METNKVKNNGLTNSKILSTDHDNDLLKINGSIIHINSYRQRIINKVSGFIYEIISYGRMKSRLESYVFGQVNNLTWTHYPSEGNECELLILGDKEWLLGRIKAYGEITFSPVLEELPKSVESRKQSLETRRFDEYSKLREELNKRGIKDLRETCQIKITLEFIPQVADIEVQHESESPLDEIRKSMNFI
jgi:hypothetical protein